ncbi:MAG: hypothetical protein JWQ09_2961 [Segetibacter sp.]|nr:hypothetical protein [Segetibacter sp.]
MPKQNESIGGRSLDSSDEPEELITEFVREAAKEFPEIKNIPKERLALLIQKFSEQAEETQQYSYEGVLPHPSIIKSYEENYPGVTRKIIDAFLEEGSHRQLLELKLVESEIEATKRGTNYALICVFIVVAACCYCAFLKSEVIAGILGAGGLATIVYVFIQGRRKSKE